MTTDMSGGPGAFRRLMNKVATWSEALSYSGTDYTLDRIACIERELAEIKDRMRQFEASRCVARDHAGTRRRRAESGDEREMPLSHPQGQTAS